MEHYAITVLKAEKARLDHELFEMKKFNDSHLAYKKAIEMETQIHYLPQQITKVEQEIIELKEAIDHMTGKKNII